MDADNDGPFVSVAILCRDVNEENPPDLIGLATQGILIRNPANIAKNFGLALMINAGRAHGFFEIEVVVRAPSGRHGHVGSNRIALSAAAPSWRSFQPLPDVFEAGLNWIDIMIDGRLAQRLPLEVVIAPPRRPN
jgi:hypothetical protein